jgi:hypothetical protein
MNRALMIIFKTQADAEAYTVVANAKARAQALQIAAEAEAEATRMAARAEADAIRLRTEADVSVQDTFAREMQYRRMDVSKVSAYGSKTIFVPMAAAASATQWPWAWRLAWEVAPPRSKTHQLSPVISVPWHSGYSAVCTSLNMIPRWTPLQTLSDASNNVPSERRVG